MNSPRTAIRIDIQLLRAAAVLSVVVFHFWPNLLVSGFAGVDVFFVISGFLITSLIVREIKSTGRLNLVNFWMRRIRRIFPAAFVVIAATAGAVALIGSPDLISGIGRHVFASMVSGENILLALDQSDYFRSAEAPSPLQHFWSLAVEEQFYVVWPLVVVLVVAFARTFKQRIRLLTTTVAFIVVGSAAFAVFLTVTNEPTGYYNSLARAWELGLGAFVAVAAAHPPMWLSDRVAIAVNRVSWVLLLATFTIPNLETGVPSWGVAPAVILTATVIATGNRLPATSTNPLVRVVRGVGHWVGDRSFSLYLWHWPILILAPYVIGDDLRTPTKVLCISLAILLSELSYRFVETPVRASQRTFLRKPVIVAPLAAVLSAAVVVSTFQLSVAIEETFTLDIRSIASTMSGEQTAERTILNGIDATGVAEFCLGAGVAVFDCPPSEPSNGSTEIKDDPRIAAGCPDATTDISLTCVLGDPTGTTRVLFIGDSHARALAGAMDIVGKKMGWRIDTRAHSSCTFSVIALERCKVRNERAVKDIQAGNFDLVVTAQSTRTMKSRARDVGQSDPRKSYSSVWRTVIDAGISVVTFADAPVLPDDVLKCMRRNFRALDRCSMTPEEAWSHRDYAVDAARQVGAHVVNLKPIFCKANNCPLSIGTVRVMIDNNHMTPQFAATLAPFIWAQMSTFNLPAR